MIFQGGWGGGGGPDPLDPCMAKTGLIRLINDKQKCLAYKKPNFWNPDIPHCLILYILLNAGLSICKEIIHSLRLVDYLHVQADML